MAIGASYGHRTDALLDGLVAQQNANYQRLIRGLPDNPDTQQNMILRELVVQVSRLADALEQLAVVTAAPLAQDAVNVINQS